MLFKKRTRNIILISFFFFMLIFISTALYYFTALTNTISEMHQPIERSITSKNQKPIVLEEKEPISILLIGVDQRKGDKGRSDTLILLTVNPKESSVKMVSIPRDTRTEIVGGGLDDKINHAYAFGGTKMTVDTVEHFFSVPIDYYVLVNMEAFQGIVDDLGGITINNPLDFNEAGHHFRKGEITLTGYETMLYVRMRKQDPYGDFGRQQRQREVIRGILNKGASLESLSKIKAILDTLEENVKTDISFGEMIDIHEHYKQTINDIETLELSGQGKILDGVYYLFVEEEVKLKVQETLLKHLEL
ncbi:LCP family protein [Cytobacillus sp. FJAT-54145]|uniref:LCP family protein n=1 Tax=Cytobacillus spartinae TaxID=3299023 RepID=A0ABW6KJJ0_9BACI